MKMIGSGDWAPVGFSFGLDWAIDLWDGVCWGLLAGGFRPKPMVPTDASSSWQPFHCTNIFLIVLPLRMMEREAQIASERLIGWMSMVREGND